jgi:hypothetical protein
MSWTRKAQSLGGIDRFSQDALFQRWLDSLAQHEVYPRYAEDFLQVMLGSGEVKQPNWPVIEFHEHIHIAGGVSFITDNGAE